jgi:hypothetical protein
MESEDYLHTLETTGRILLFTPALVSLILFIFGVSDIESFKGSGAFFASGLMMQAGFFMLMYAAALQFRQGLRKAR